VENVHSVIITNQELRVALTWYPDDRFIYVHAIEDEGTISPSHLHSRFIGEVTSSAALTHMQQHLHALLTLRACSTN
jgi:hypothetical protein